MCGKKEVIVQNSACRVDRCSCGNDEASIGWATSRAPRQTAEMCSRMLVAAGVGIVLGLGASDAAAQQDGASKVRGVSTYENVLGTSCEIVIETAGCEDGAPSQDVCARAEERILAEIGRLKRIASRHEADSEFSIWQRHARVQPRDVSHELFELLAASERWQGATGGAFHPGAASLAAHLGERSQAAAIGSRGAVSVAEASARKDGAKPSAGGVGLAQRLELAPCFELDSATFSARVLTPADSLSLDGLAKGYILDAAADAAMEIPGVSGLLLNIGGDLVVRGSCTHAIAIADPRHPADNTAPLRRVRLRHRQAIATSGGYAREVKDSDGRAGSHIRDPRTGRSSEQVLSATVVGAVATDVDALATALNVLEPADGLKLIEDLDGYECLLVCPGGDVQLSSGFGAWCLAEAATPVRPAATSSSWPADLEVAVELELARPDKAGRGAYRRPYVAVWVEDADGKSVRTLCLWIEGRRWLRDLTKWYRKHRKDVALIDKVSRATRRPGVYSLVWNGRGDDGTKLPPGSYLICVEVAREHGTHQLQRQLVDVRAESYATFEVEPNAEVQRLEIAVRSRAR